MGGSIGNFDEATALDFTSDALAGINYLKSRKEINHELIGMIGHSEGGMIAPMAAVQTPDVAFMVLIASPGLAIKEMEYSEQARELKGKGASEDFIAKKRAVKDMLFKVITEETDNAVVLEKFKKILTEKKTCRCLQKRISLQLKGHSKSEEIKTTRSKNCPI